ncbi:transcriptional regulator, TetR family [Pilibacter termitis]|uniref:Transcriptional regulator, TetR family n=1 Tax=Pilibacter termitis TaxID=263852 RepID=A0A1T4L9R2_9ENTE|nr:TetR/AcrR family transcriptional regulator [Pilibacter termitis]SJZ51479.1 transcriptional regulator, TetR family [Pilibacter termitis]
MDLRVKKTQKAIFEAFIKLSGEKGVESVTVQDISKEAMINRATFYAHYKDKEDLYNQILDSLVTSFTSVIDEEKVIVKNRLQVKKIELILSIFYKEVRSTLSSAYALFEGSSQEILRQKFAAVLQKKYETIFKVLRITENKIEVPVDFIIEYMTGIFISTLHWWMKTDSEMTPQQMAQLVVKLIGNGHLTVLGIEVER